MTWDPATFYIVAATVAGPILAVQAQKAVERLKERESRKTWVFETLVSTVGQRLSTEHVRALNMIDLAFYGTRWLGVIHRRSRNEQEVIDAWHEYLKQLNTLQDMTSDPGNARWTTTANDLFYNLLHALSKERRYKGTRDQLKQSGYSPQAHGYMEMEQNAIRQNAALLLSGHQALKIQLSMDQKAVDEQQALRDKLLAALQTGSLSVDLKQPEK